MKWTSAYEVTKYVERPYINCHKVLGRTISKHFDVVTAENNKKVLGETKPYLNENQNHRFIAKEAFDHIRYV